jgi:hypothetical protein
MVEMLQGNLPLGLVRPSKKNRVPGRTKLNLDGITVEVLSVIGGIVRLKFGLSFKGVKILDLNEVQCVQCGDTLTVHGLKIKHDIEFS